MMKRQRVGVIGAGISGVVAAAHLKKEGVDVIVFERSSAAGGVWLYDERKPLEPLYSSLLPSKAGLANIPNGSNGHKFDASQIAQLLHAPPGPCYVGLNNNVSTRLLETTLNPFPPATPDFVSHEVLKNYIQDTASVSGIQDVIRYNTEVQRLSKGDGKWTVDASVLDVVTGSIKKRREIWKFDSVIVASGHYHAPRIPDIPGLAQWKQKWPHRIQHSKSYRRPEDFEQGKNFLLIGGSVSATDIARELSPRAKTIYQSHRNGAFDLPPSLLPENAVRIGEIASFDNPETSTNSKGEPDAGNHLPLAITLKSGERLCDIDYVIICTGYHITLPFLSHLHDDFTEPSRASQSVLVTDGLQLHNLYKDMWYIPDPSLIFIGVPYFTATFTLFEFQAIVVAKVVGRGLPLPSEAELRKEYEEKIREKGLGKSFHSLRDAEEAYVDNLLLWLNEELDRAGFTQEKVPGHTEKWKVAKEEQRQRMQQLFAPNGGVTSNGVEKAHWWNC